MMDIMTMQLNYQINDPFGGLRGGKNIVFLEAGTKVPLLPIGKIQFKVVFLMK